MPKVSKKSCTNCLPRGLDCDCRIRCRRWRWWCCCWCCCCCCCCCCCPSPSSFARSRIGEVQAGRKLILESCNDRFNAGRRCFFKSSLKRSPTPTPTSTSTTSTTTGSCRASASAGPQISSVLIETPVSHWFLASRFRSSWFSCCCCCCCCCCSQLFKVRLRSVLWCCCCCQRHYVDVNCRRRCVVLLIPECRCVLYRFEFACVIMNYAITLTFCQSTLFMKRTPGFSTRTSFGQFYFYVVFLFWAETGLGQTLISSWWNLWPKLLSKFFFKFKSLVLRRVLLFLSFLRIIFQ